MAEGADKHEEAPVSRQAFLRHGLSALMASVAEVLPDISAVAPPQPAGLLRPPGALPGEAFSSTCQPFCAECREVCPRDAIFQDAFGFPFIDPTTAPCVMCTDVPCTRVCPTGALTPLATPAEIRMGTAVIELTVCSAYHGSGCTECFTQCPIPDRAIRLNEGLPEILPDGCTGCGVCVHACPTPGAIAITPLV